MGRESIACRVCMKKSKDNVEFEAIFVRKTRITYLEGYNICTQLNAFIGDGLPAIICTYCKDELRTAFRFMEKAKETDRRLREKLGANRITRSSRRIKQEESNKMADVETAFDEIKTEFINCSKDPLEDSDMEAGEKSEDEIEIHWGSQSGSEMDKDGFAGEKTGIDGDGDGDEDEDEDDDKPLKELIKREKFKPVVEDSVKTDVNFDSSDVFNDLPEPDNYSSADENAFNDKMVERIPDPPTTAEAQIFPQGRYMCKLCNKTYFTAAGLKAHIAVHMTKKKKVRRVRGPNKKGKKKKSKRGDDDDDDEDDGEADAEGDGSKSKEEDTAVVDGETNDLLEIKEDGSTTVVADSKDGKKKRKAKAPKPKKMFPCHVCGKHMISASKLRYHMVMHTGEKDYLCTMCPKAYSTIYALKHHMRTHTGERPYECKFCGDKFTRPTTLKSHMRRHTGERPYGCDICGKRFIQHSSMTTHMKLNHMAKTIACPHCDKKYARQTDLNTHLLSHTGDKPFSCELCPSRFIRQANLNKHMNQHHAIKNVLPGNTALASKPIVTAGGATITLTSVPSTLPTSIDIISGQSMQQQRQDPNQNQPPLPRVINVRSLAKVVSRVSVSTTVVHGITTSSGLVGTDETNSSNQSTHMLPPARPSQLPPAQSSQSSHHSAHLQQSHMGPPQQLTNNENSIPMGMNIERIPGGIPTHNMLSAIPISGGGPDHDAGHGRMESVEHLKGIHPPVDNLTNLLGQVIDPERMGRSVDDLIRWSWPNAS